jgi:hypothetical protein
MATIADYGGILAALITVLKGDAELISLLANGADSIVYATSGNAAEGDDLSTPSVDDDFPLLTVRDIAIAARNPQHHEFPSARALMTIQIDLWGASFDLRPVLSVVDSVLEKAHEAGAMDTVDWRFGDIDTSGIWNTIQTPAQFRDSTLMIEQRSKDYTVVASALGAGV